MILKKLVTSFGNFSITSSSQAVASAGVLFDFQLAMMYFLISKLYHEWGKKNLNESHAVCYDYSMANQHTHPWTIQEINFIKGNFREKTYKEIGQIIGRSASSVQSKVRFLPFQKKVNKYEIYHNFFQRWSCEMAYVLGFITADGNLQKTKYGHLIHIAADDYDVIAKIKVAMKMKGRILEKKRKNGKISYSLRFSDKIIFNDLFRLGLTPRKSLTIKPPSIPNRFLWDYIRGFFDGDGCVYIRTTKYPSKLHVLFYTGSFAMAKFLYKVFKIILPKYKGKIMVRKKMTNYYILHFGQKDSNIIFKYLYKNASLFMKRKHEIFMKGLNDNKS